MHIVARQFNAPSSHLFGALLVLDEPLPPVLSQPLWLYGKGELCELAKEFFRYASIEVAGSFEYEEPAPLDAQVAVCIVRNRSYSEIQRQLRLRGFWNIAPVYDLINTIGSNHPLKNGWVANPSRSDIEKMEGVYRRWSDDASRAHYLQFLAWRIAREEWIFDGLTVTKDNLFFIPEVVDVMHDHEVFIDGGAHLGETSEALLKLSPKAQVHMFEPSDKSRAKITVNGPVKGIALSDVDGWAPFTEGFGMCSKLDPKGTVMRPTWKIDSLRIPATFIKLHLEGGDLAALRGAEATLLKHRPIVAVRIDHNPDGLWRTADHLMNTLDGYRFLFRNHCWCGAAAVIYAIPRERHV